MRVNSYNKFFAEVAKIMNTEVKSVKQLDGRYKVELTNHVCLNVYRGVSGSLFIHDHRGMARITSCYDFDDFKTLKDLYERLITDYSESTNTAEKHYDDYTSEDFINAGIAKECTECPDFCEEDCIENAECARGNDVMQCMMCAADREGNWCGGKQWCKQTWKRYDAIVNPEWHHVSMATLANIDNDMLDEKRRNYMYLYNLIKDFRKYAFKIIRKDVYFETTSNVFRNIQQLYFNNVISFTTYDYAAKHIQTVGVEKGLFDSKSEETFGYKESRRYKVTLR